MRCQFHHLWAVAIAFCVGMAPVVAHATAPPPQHALGDEPVRYMGGFLGVGLFGGIEALQDQRWRSPVGWSVGVSGRVATVLSLLDLQLDYGFGRMSLDVDDAPTSDLVLDRHSLAASLNLHPLFLKILANDWWAYLLSAGYVQLGFSTELSRFRSADPDSRRSETSFALHWGAGIDVPLGNVNTAHTLWLGIMWRWKFVFMEPELAGDAPNELNAHLLVLTLGYRYNNLNFARLERPDELHFR